MMDLLQIPGYLEAIEKERLIRDAAFLGVTESIWDFEALPLTLRHYLTLRLMKSPFLPSFERLPTPGELAAFLWVVSPHYSPDESARDAFLVRCRVFCPPLPPKLPLPWLWKRWHERLARADEVAKQTIKAARDYVAEAFTDKPPRPTSLGFEPSYYSDAASLCAMMARDYGWTQEQTLEAPMKVIFQYLNERKEANGAKVPLFNPISDRVLNAHIENINRSN